MPNFYIDLPGCYEACSHCAERMTVHLGKSFSGLRFLHRAYRTGINESFSMKVHDRKSWETLLDLGTIYRYGGQLFTKQELLDLIEMMQGRGNHENPRGWALSNPGGEYDFLSRRHHHFSDSGYSFCDAEFN